MDEIAREQKIPLYRHIETEYETVFRPTVFREKWMAYNLGI